MNTQKLKTVLLNLFGDSVVAYLQGLRFAYLIKKKTKRDPEADYLDRLIRRGDVAIDVGANGADWTYQLHGSVGPNGHIFAFEADPYYALATNIAIKILRLRNVTFFSHGLSDGNQELFLRIEDSNGERLSGRGYIDKDADPEEKGIVRVRLKSLDSLIKDYPLLLQTKFIKCDVEGFELFVFRGCREIVEKSRPIAVIEVGGSYRGYNPEDLHKFFEDRTYRAFAVTKDRHFQPTDERFQARSAVGVNRILIPNERVSEFDDLIVDE